MENQFNEDKARSILDAEYSKAQTLLGEPSQVDELLFQIQEKLKQIPAAGQALSEVPLMISMVKSYITKEYPEVSVKVIATIVGAFIYMVKKNDLISDSIPVLGYMDDIAVLAFALKFVEPELRAYENWKKGIR